MIRVVVLLFVAMGIAPVVKAQAFKAALFSEDYGAVRVVNLQEGNSFHLVYNVPDEKYVKINIVNEQDRVVFTEVFRNQGSFRRPYNMEKLPKGEYTFKITGRMGTYTQLVTVE